MSPSFCLGSVAHVSLLSPTTSSASLLRSTIKGAASTSPPPRTPATSLNLADSSSSPLGEPLLRALVARFSPRLVLFHVEEEEQPSLDLDRIAACWSPLTYVLTRKDPSAGPLHVSLPRDSGWWLGRPSARSGPRPHFRPVALSVFSKK